jgi:hypothetical protein
VREPGLDLLEFARPIPERMNDPGSPIPASRIEIWCDDLGGICPRCHRRYAAGVERCEDCGASLLPESPEPAERPRVDDHRFVPVLRTGDESRITFVSSALEGSGVAFSVHQGDAADGPAGTIEIWVPPGRADEAREVIERLDEAPVAVEDE